jgi:hypothetical protein
MRGLVRDACALFTVQVTLSRLGGQRAGTCVLVTMQVTSSRLGGL